MRTKNQERTEDETQRQNHMKHKTETKNTKLLKLTKSNTLSKPQFDFVDEFEPRIIDAIDFYVSDSKQIGESDHFHH